MLHFPAIIKLHLFASAVATPFHPLRNFVDSLMPVASGSKVHAAETDVHHQSRNRASHLIKPKQMSSRQNQYKNRGALRADELRRRREDVAVEIRKQKRDENLAKRRNLATISGSASESEEDDHAGSMDQVRSPFRHFLDLSA